jgi:2-(1,2-epoxy-1,2-dihydrophenyl)acetyl-CoA isomerase
MTVSYSPVSYSYGDGVARITLDDGDRGNPIHPASVAALRAAVRQSGADDARVILLAATGRFFSVGGDISQFGAAEDIGSFVDDLAEDLHRTVSDLVRSPAIVVCAVQGMAAGAGFPLAAAADVVLAGASARFTLAYTKIGLSPDGGSSLLTASLGLHRALHLALLNPVLTAEQARLAGLVAEVHPDEELEAAVARVVDQLLAGSRSAQVAAKRLFREGATRGAEGALRRETLSIRACAAGVDGREGVDAFVGKRAPVFFS